MPAATSSATDSKMAENKNSVKVLEELMSKLTVSKAQEDINAASKNLATFINGAIEEKDVPTQYVSFAFHYCALHRLAIYIPSCQGSSRGTTSPRSAHLQILTIAFRFA